jgi:hypothetical protein
MILMGAVASVTLVGLTVGLGAWWIDPGAQDAARVVSSSNGALVLVLMLGYVGCVISALVLAWHGWLLGRPGLLAVATVALLGVSAIVGVWPVRRGAQVLAHLELTGENG